LLHQSIDLVDQWMEDHGTDMRMREEMQQCRR
jgi:hypothetical protein